MQGKVVVVTGGFGALGRTLVETATARGAQAAAIDVAPAGQVRGAGLALSGVDLADGNAAARAMKAVHDKFGRIDALANVAGGFAWQTLGDGDLSTWSRLFALNVLSCASACQAARPYLVESKGAIVNVGAHSALKAAAGMGAYAAAKQGVMKLTEALAEEMKGKVRVNAVLPSIIDTPTNRKDMPTADFSSWVRAEELAEAILFLASDAASAITGALVPVIGRV